MAGEDLQGGSHIKTTGKFQEAGPAIIKADKTMRFVSLHHHSTFSYQDGYAMPEAHVRRAAEDGMVALALTEHGNVSSHVKLEKAGVKAGVKPIFGVELYTGDVDPDRRGQRKNHLTVLARDQRGYQNLLSIVTKSYDNFYYEPTADGFTLAKHKAGLFILSGCQGSLLATSLVGGKNIEEKDASYERAKRVARRMKNAFGDSFFLEVQMFPELERARQINTYYERLSKELDIPLVATGDVHYTKPSESEMQAILHAIRSGKHTFEEQQRSWGYDVPLTVPPSDELIMERLRGTGLSLKGAQQALANTQYIGQECNVVLPKLPDVKFPIPPGYRDTRDVWRSWITEGWRFRNIGSKDNWKRYKEQLEYEMDIIEQKKYVDYFLVVSDIVKFAKGRGIPVGPGRGSSAASLVCYLLRITEVDPLQWSSLVFERFIDLTRQDLPDIDIDFDDARRDEVREYAVEKYGVEQVANIGTFTAYKAKNSLDDVARVYRVPKWAVEELKGYMIERSSGDLRADSTIEDTAEMFPRAGQLFDMYPDLRQAMKLEGNLRGMGIHSAGLIISSEPITQACALYTRFYADGRRVTVSSLDKYDAEYLNILKIDALGLSTLGMFSEAMELIGMTLEDLYALPLDDAATVQGFMDNEVVGIFQFDGRATRNVCQEVRPDNIQEICNIGALSRPGPLHGGATGEYIEVRHGRKPRRSIHPVFDDICEPTYGTIVFQEQILRIVRELGNFDWTHASYIRKIISKKMGEQEFNRQWDTFWQGCKANGLSEKEAGQIWRECITAGAYAFNAAHTISYGLISYWSMWIKQNYPGIFYAAALRRLPEGKDKKKHLELMRDAVNRGIDIVAPDVRTSQAKWTWTPEEPEMVRAGFEQIPGIGDKMAPVILKYREEHGLEKWNDLLDIKGIGPKKLETMLAMVEDEDPFGIHALEKLMQKVRGEIRHNFRVPNPTHRAKDIPYSKGKDEEVVWCGVIMTRNLRDMFEYHFSKHGTELDPNTVKDPHLKEYVTMLAQDETDVVNLTINRWAYPRFKEAVWGMRPGLDVVLVHGVKSGRQARRALTVRKMWVFGEDDTEEEEDG